MPKDDATPHALVGRAGLVFAYVCFLFAVAMFGGALYFLPLSFKAKVFFAIAITVIVFMFASMAAATHLIYRSRPRVTPQPSRADQKEVGATRTADAKGSHRPG